MYYLREYLNDCQTGGSGSISVQVSLGCWCGKQNSLFHSSANVTPFFCSSASVSGESREFKLSQT